MPVKSAIKQVIAIVDMGRGWERDYLRRSLENNLGKHIEIKFFDKPAEEVISEIKSAEILSVFIKSKVDKTVIQAMPKLQFITTQSTGYDHIDYKTAKAKGIPVSNVPTYGENTVAEHTFALILSLSRNLRKAYFKNQAGDFSLEGLIGFDLKGKTLGVVGTGNIGLHVIRIAVAFGMKVLAFDVQKKSFMSEVLNFEYVSLEELLKNSDIISLHVPSLPSTIHMINDKTIHQIKKGAMLINTARGNLIETGALVKALDKKILSGVGLDVLEGEEYILEEKRLLDEHHEKVPHPMMGITVKNHVLLHRDNVIFTPHMAFYSREAVERILDTTVENIAAFLKGHPINLVK